jgi:uncharacterized Zn-finger protein
MTVHHFFQRVCGPEDVEVTSRYQTVHMSEPQNNWVKAEECVSDVHYPGDNDNSVTQDTSARKHRPGCSYICDVCKKAFTYQSTLKVYLCIHTGERSFSSDMCKKGFTQHSNLNCHQCKHTGERRCSSDVCNKRFVRQSHLKQHLHIHTGECPLACDVCKKSFRYQLSLNKHVKIHSRKHLYSCNVCEKSSHFGLLGSNIYILILGNIPLHVMHVRNH